MKNLEILQEEFKFFFNNKEYKKDIDKYIKIKKIKIQLDNEEIDVDSIKNFYWEEKLYYIFEIKDLRNKLKKEEVLNDLIYFIDNELNYQNIFMLLNFITPKQIPVKIINKLIKVTKSKIEYKRILKEYLETELTFTKKDKSKTIKPQNKV